MKKTANTVNVGDKFYHPIVDDIEEFLIVEIKKTSRGIMIGARYFGLRIDNSYENAAISTKIKFTGRNTNYFLNLEDAEKHQKLLQEKHLKYLQEKANEALQILNQFTLKYFTNETP